MAASTTGIAFGLPVSGSRPLPIECGGVLLPLSSISRVRAEEEEGGGKKRWCRIGCARGENLLQLLRRDVRPDLIELIAHGRTIRGPDGRIVDDLERRPEIPATIEDPKCQIRLLVIGTRQSDLKRLSGDPMQARISKQAQRRHEPRRGDRVERGMHPSTSSWIAE